MKPIIGITGFTLNSFLPKLDKGNEEQKKTYEVLKKISPAIEAIFGFNDASLQFAFENDIKAIKRAGGIPLIIPALNDSEALDVILERLDGILLTGGYDIDPKHYNEEDLYSKGLLGSIDTLSDEDAGLLAKFSEKKDLSEFDLVRKSHLKGLPIMGICRGAQVINVAMGGSIHQDLLKQEVTKNNHSDISSWNTYAHEIDIDDDTFLKKTLQKDKLKVNSIHHQAINNVSNNLKITATAEDGVIECIENVEGSLIIGVQWHPEMLKNDPDSNKLFKAFINECTS